ncbi:ergot alkaloid biosynthetic protein a [Moniliophthora roreri]|uniref:Ketoreductase (KR) domain-containing protein n=1 Tax=Moniliophthora roreri TaxID=221103 RepID=A0A0W0FJB0_MONRR|nr:ergot alkaloid biosynthetic protein a [Moniliophthora roreri]
MSSIEEPAILLVGGTGTTGLPLSKLLLSKTDYTLLITSRRGSQGIPADLFETCSNAGARIKGVNFDWDDRSTFENLFSDETRAVGTDEITLGSLKVEAMYLVPPYTGYTDNSARVLVDLAVEHEVSRIVLLSDTLHEKGELSIGAKLQEYLHELKKAGKIETYAVLRPSWFYRNFIQLDRGDILQNNQISSMKEDGRIGWVSVATIAETALHALVDDHAEVAEQYIITGPNLHSCDDTAAILTQVLGREIRHHRLTLADFLSRWSEAGFPKEYVDFLATCDQRAASGKDEAMFNLESDPRSSLKRVKGSETLEDYLRDNESMFTRSRIDDDAL